MATVAYRIVSHYGRPIKEKPGNEANPVEDEESWNQGHTFGLSKRITNPPKFVRGGAYDIDGRPHLPEGYRDDDEEIQIIGVEKTLGSWYRNLPRSNYPSAATISPNISPPRSFAELNAHSATHVAVPELGPHPEGVIKHNHEERDWFIANVLPALASSHSSSSASLGDMLDRAPPPLPSERAFVPPVWLAIGPTNRGYGMLQRNGWEEGQPLGLEYRRQQVSNSSMKVEPSETFFQDTVAPKKPTKAKPVKASVMRKPVEFIDLTLSDDDEETGGAGSSGTDAKRSGPPSISVDSSRSDISLQSGNIGSSPQTHAQDNDHGAHALLIPLPTILKADRLGIGLRNKHSQRTIHRSADALKVHADTAKGRKFARNTSTADRSNLPGEGPPLGSKSTSKKRKRQERERAEMLAYMNNQ